MARVGNLASGPRDDLNHDGYNLAREQAMGADPLAPTTPFKMDLAIWNPTMARLSWPGRPGLMYQGFSGTQVGQPLGLVTNLAAGFPETEWFVPLRTNYQFFKVISTP
jgi:hypothetical protein